MPSFHRHHCPICSRIGDKRCLNLEHYVACVAHPNNYHSKQTECIKCIEAERRKERSEAVERNNENEDLAANKVANKKVKKVKVRPLHEKTIKQLRRERRLMRQGASDTTDLSTSDGSVMEVEDVEKS